MTGETEPQGRGTPGFAIAGLVLGLVGVVAGIFATAFDYELVLILGVLAVVFAALGLRRARGMAIAGLVLGVITIGLGIVGYSILNDAFNGIDSSTGETNTTAADRELKASEKRLDFCQTTDGDALDRAGAATTDSPAELRTVTRKALKAAEDAPPGAECAVTALTNTAESWNIYASDPGYEDAEERVREIRSFQREHKLKKLL